MCFILCMFCVRSLYNSLRDSSLLRQILSRGGGLLSRPEVVNARYAQ